MNAQQLKNSILQEAIEGRLVPQDPNDEPASVLLDKIRKEKARLVKEGKLKKKDLEETPIPEDEKPFEIPESWEWCRVCDITDSYIGLTYKPTDVSTNGWIVLRSSNIQDGLLDYNDIVRVNMDIPEKLRVQVNDIIICARNGSKKLVGKSALVREVNEPTTFGAFMAICRTKFYEYMAKYLLSPLFFQQLRKDSDTTTINQLTQKNFNRYLVPLPPLAEQKRIVAKIEELLPKVEEYGKAQEALDKLNEELPERLKKSILQEAIEGRLVPQDPNDEPASVLLDKIRKEKAKLVKEGKLKKKDLEEFPVSEDEIPFDIPDNWIWCKLGTITAVLGGKRIPAGRKLSIEKTGHIYIRVSDMKENTVSTDNLQYVPEDIFPSISKYIINKEDVYITVAGTIGKIGKIPSELDGANLTENADRLVFSHLNQDWLIKCLESNVVQAQITGVTTKVGQPKLAILRIQTLLIPLPPLAEQHRIVAKIERLMNEIDKLKV